MCIFLFAKNWIKIGILNFFTKLAKNNFFLAHLLVCIMIKSLAQFPTFHILINNSDISCSLKFWFIIVHIGNYRSLWFGRAINDRIKINQSSFRLIINLLYKSPVTHLEKSRCLVWMGARTIFLLTWCTILLTVNTYDREDQGDFNPCPSISVFTKSKISGHIFKTF